MKDFRDLSRALADNAEAFCAHYLSNGRRNGSYWLVGDVHNTPGQSLYVRLFNTQGGGAAGKWTDAATGDHGDLLDLIRLNMQFSTAGELRTEARRFLMQPATSSNPMPAARNSPLAARRLFHASEPLIGTLGERYLRGRAITAPLDHTALRYHPSCYTRSGAPPHITQHPAIIAAVTDVSGSITGALRIYLDPITGSKALLAYPRKSMGNILGHGIRLGPLSDVAAAGEGLETMLALQSLIPEMPVIAATSASHLGALIIHPQIKRLYIALDNDAAGKAAAQRIKLRHQESDVALPLLRPLSNDWNDDLVKHCPARVRANLLRQLHVDDRKLLDRQG